MKSQFTARMDTYDHGLSLLFQGPGAAANDLIGIKSVLVKCLFIWIGTGYTVFFKMSSQIKFLKDWGSDERGSYTSKIKYVDMIFFSCFHVGNSFLKFVQAF